MATALEIAQDVAADLTFEAPLSLFSPDDADQSASRRLRRAITKTAKYLNKNIGWSDLRREHSFTTIAGELQPGAIPHDFGRIIEGTAYDNTRRMELGNPLSERDWTTLKRGYAAVSGPRWMIRGRDMLIQPSWTAGSKISFSYYSNVICREKRTATEVLYSVNGGTLEAGKRYVVGLGHTITLPPLAPEETIELVPVSGSFSNLGVTINLPTGCTFSGAVPNTSNIVTVVRAGSVYSFVAQVGAWTPDLRDTETGQTLEVGRRYVIQPGHIVYLPVLANGEYIQMLPKGGSWSTLGAAIVSRRGLNIGPQLDAFSGLVTVVGNMEAPNGVSYVLQSTLPSDDPWAYEIRKPELTADTDELLFDKEMMIAGTIWLMNYRDGNTYNEDFRAFQRLINDHMKGDGGPRVIDMSGRSGSSASSLLDRMKSNAVVASDITWSESEW